MFGYFFFLILTFPLAMLVHSVLADYFGIVKNRVFEAIVYGVLCSPCIVAIGDGYRHKTLALGLYALLRGQDPASISMQMIFCTLGIYLFLRYKDR